MLIKLPNGDHINPQDVQSVTITPSDPHIVCQVVVRVSGVEHIIPREGLGCGSEARVLRDQIAEQINAACYTDRRR